MSLGGKLEAALANTSASKFKVRGMGLILKASNLFIRSHVSLVFFQVIRITINGISHLIGDYLGVPEYLYRFDFKIQCLSESLHKCFILSYIVCAFKFQAACDHHLIAMWVNEEIASTCSFLVPGTIKV